MRRPYRTPLALASDTVATAGPMPTKCLLWKWGRTTAGYASTYPPNGTKRPEGRMVYGHRHFYEERHGKIRRGLTIDHLCRVRHCVNPDHLEPVSYAINIRRGEQAKLSAAQVVVLQNYRAWKQRRGEKMPQKALCAALGIKKSNLDVAARGKIWKGLRYKGLKLT